MPVKFLLVLVAALAGCAAFVGQVPYEGPVQETPYVGFESHRTIERCGPYGQGRCLGQDRIGYVANPTEYPIKVDIDCNDLQTLYTGIVIQPRSTQYFNVSRVATRCWLPTWQFVYHP